MDSGYFKASIKARESDVFLIAVPTPFKGSVKGSDIPEPDISYVESSILEIIPFIREGNLVVIESTSPVGTTEKMAELIYLKRPDLKGEIYLAYCPERVLPGQVIYELENNDRSIGGIDEPSTKKAIDFYSLFVKGDLHSTNSRTAEMSKLTENAFRDVNIAFANELSIICDKANIDVSELIGLTNKHPRVNILQPGPGVGGHCIAVDPWFIVSDYPEDAKIIKSARNINNYKEEWTINKIIIAAVDFENKNNKKPIVACMGLSYKPDIDDLRESPALNITKKINLKTENCIVVEPNIEKFDGLNVVSLDTAIEKADIFVFLVAHKKFKKLSLLNKLVLDFCGVSNC